MRWHNVLGLRLARWGSPTLHPRLEKSAALPLKAKCKMTNGTSWKPEDIARGWRGEATRKGCSLSAALVYAVRRQLRSQTLIVAAVATS